LVSVLISSFQRLDGPKDQWYHNGMTEVNRIHPHPKKQM
jgi:hypothetical protein